MDNNNQTPVTNVVQPVQDPVPSGTGQAQVAQGVPPAVGSAFGGSNKMIWIIGIVVAIIIVLGVATYMLMGKQGGSKTGEQSGINVTDLQTDVDSIRDEDLDSDFKALDSDLQNL